MPKLVRLYITHALIGFGIAALFIVGLVWADVARLQHLVLGTDMGWLAGLMLFVSLGSVFGGVQFGIAVMRMADRDDTGPRGGRREAIPEAQPVPVLAGARRGR